MQAARYRSRPGLAEPPNAGLLVRLRHATAEAHRRVESRLFPSALTDRTSYAGMLRVLLALHEPIEAGLAELPGLAALGIEPAERRKAPWLRADLIALGADPPSAPYRAGASPSAPPGLPEALGAFYVLEGSTLGGRVLLEAVRTRLGKDVPTRFLSGYRERTGRYWRQTRAALLHAVGTDVDPTGAAERLIDSACATFTHLDRLLDEDGWAAA